MLRSFVGSAYAQAASEPLPVDVPGGAAGELLLLLAALVGFVFLSKLYVRWPRAEPWLVGISLVVFVPAAAFLLFVTTNGRAAYAETLPWLVLVAPLLGGLWWVVKTKTELLGHRPRPAPSADAIRPQPASPPLTDNSPPAAASARQSPAGASSPAAARTEQLQRAAASNKIFVSYRRQDSADVTGRIYDRLVQRFDKEQIFKDVDSIPLGVDFREHLGRVVGQCDVLLAVMGNDWLAADSSGRRRIDDAKDFVRIEIESALERGIPVIPVLVRGAAMPSEADMPASLVALSYRHGIDVRPDPDFHRDMDRLIAGLEGHLDGRR